MPRPGAAASVTQRREQLDVDGEEVVETAQRVETLRRLVRGLGEREERDGAVVTVLPPAWSE